MAPKVS
jgi:hypothetical protein